MRRYELLKTNVGMARFYDFLFYFIYKFYSSKEKGAASSSAGIIGGLQAINVLTVFMLAAFLISPKSHFSKVIMIVVLIFFQVLTYMRYIYGERNSTQKVEERWLRMNDVQKERFRIIGIIYILCSILVFVGLSIYVGLSR